MGEGWNGHSAPAGDSEHSLEPPGRIVIYQTLQQGVFSRPEAASFHGEDLSDPATRDGGDRRV
jgi:hypothetical protein